MKQHLFPALALSTVLLCAAAPPAAQAFQETDSTSTQATHQIPSPEEMVSRLDQKLSLTDDQKAKITPIIADRQKQMRALAADQSLRLFQKARKMKSIFSESDEKIKALLTDDQKQKYIEFEQQLRDQMKERRQQHPDSNS